MALLVVTAGAVLLGGGTSVGPRRRPPWCDAPYRPSGWAANGLHRASSLRALIREYLFVSLFRASAESLASENASRLAAMQRADRNIDELLWHLRHTFHRLRQSGIDEELFDVVAGFEAFRAKHR